MGVSRGRKSGIPEVLSSSQFGNAKVSINESVGL